MQFNDENNIENIIFSKKIDSLINGLELQRWRINNFNSSVHDADHYMILVRRLFRKVEYIAKYDSRVANLKGSYKQLYQKIKIRDDFEHEVKHDNVKLDMKTLIDLGIIKEGSTIGNIIISTSVLGNNIVSGNHVWNLIEDHQLFIDMLKKLMNLHPFKTRVESNQNMIKQLLKINKKLQKSIQKNEIKIEILENQIDYCNSDSSN